MASGLTLTLIPAAPPSTQRLRPTVCAGKCPSPKSYAVANHGATLVGEPPGAGNDPLDLPVGWGFPVCEGRARHERCVAGGQAKNPSRDHVRRAGGRGGGV